MRLIHAKTRRFCEFLGKPPPYAILSHTWWPDEVTYQDLCDDRGTQSGWWKILHTCQQALEDGLQFVWIDTCCINKSSSAELSESINSMFHWYEQAAICYALLDDVELLKEVHKAKWFTRGWTLQELLAPNNVVFYNGQWEKIGTRAELANLISTTSGIDTKALHGLASRRYIRTTSIAKRMSWAARRETTRDEDTAYSLLGLFGVNMPLLYGEGGIKAFERLQEEVMKSTSDHTILAWHMGWGTLARERKVGLLAYHPLCFEESRSVELTGVDSTPIYSHSRGLQIQMPIFKSAAFKNRYIGILACAQEHDVPCRVGIQLSAVDRSARTFLFEPAFGLRTLEENEIRAARTRDCCILRSRPRPNRRLLWVSVQDVKRNIRKGLLHLNEPSARSVYGHWKCGTSDKEYLGLPGRGIDGVLTYGVIVTKISPTWESSYLIRVDVGDDTEPLSSRYTSSVCITKLRGWDRFYDPGNLPVFPSNHLKVDPKRHARVVVSDLHRSTLCASLSWKRRSGQDVLVLQINMEEPHKNTANSSQSFSGKSIWSLTTARCYVLYVVLSFTASASILRDETHCFIAALCVIAAVLAVWSFIQALCSSSFFAF